MNPLKEQPHLFANGKFFCKWADNSSRRIVEYQYRTENSFYVLSNNNKIRCDNAVLVARPISGMTDEELEGVLETDCYSSEYAMELLIEKAEKGTLLGYHERNMANIGVYFGPLLHFDDGTVLNINEVQ